jgi:hypothetical protein
VTPQPTQPAQPDITSHLQPCHISSCTPVLQLLQQLLPEGTRTLPPARPVLLHCLLQAAYQLLLPLHLLL